MALNVPEILQVYRGCLTLRTPVSSRKAAGRTRSPVLWVWDSLPLGPDSFSLCTYSVEEAPMGQPPGTRRMDEWLVLGSVLRKEKENVFHKNANLAGLDGQGL